MGSVRKVFGWARRSQVWVGLIVIGCVGWGCNAAAQHQEIVVSPPPISPVVVDVRKQVDCSLTACLALTFDDGPDAATTPRVLDTLKRYDARATFFVLGSHVGGNETLLKRIHKEGHEIGNHSWAHPYFTRISLEQVEQEITNTQNAIASAGVPAPHLFRPPYGDMNEAVAGNIPLTIVRWNIDPEDWHPKRRENMLAHLAAQAKPGGVVVLHDTEVFTADTLEQLLVQLDGKYELVTISELFGFTPGQRGVYFGR